MKQKNDKLRNLLQDVFSDYEVTPEPDDWNRIAESLNKAKERRRFLWTVWSSAATILLLLALYTGNEYLSKRPSVAITHHTNTNAKYPIAVVKSPSSGILSSVQQPNEKKVLAKPVHEQATAKNIKAEKSYSDRMLAANNPKLTEQKQFPLINKQQPEANSQKQSSSLTLPVDKKNTDKAVTTNPILASVDTRKEVAEKKAKEQLAQEQLNALKENREVKKIKSTRSFILSGLALGNSSGFQPQGGSSSPPEIYSDPSTSALASNFNYLNSVKIYDLTSVVTPNISSIYQNVERNFKPPITIALTATFSLGNKFSLESGLQYTNLQSDGQVAIKSTNNNQFVTYNAYNINEVLHYVGVPLFMNYTFTGSKRLKAYISSGFTFEKGIRANYKVVSRDNIPGAIELHSHNSIKGLQESFTGGIGLGYSFIPHFELYIQPSLTYYFNSNSSNVTIYSTNPWLINLRSGIRYNFK